ncbi:MAG: helicase-exonuclease AddAB subunit AddA [Eubacteriales bacterium]|jgi:ATP-dependent helicase/nuclease subunit A
MAVSLTSEQKNAVFSRDRNTLVAAAAGSGKTRVIIERIMDKLIGSMGCNITDFLIITFTNAAAGELRDRLERELSDRIRLNPSDRNLRRQLTLLPRAQITTIDSFCYSVLREFSHLCEVNPSVAIVEGAEAELLMAEALENSIESLYGEIEGLPDFAALAELLSAARDDRLLSSAISDAYEKIQSHPFPDLWMKEMLSLYENPPSDFEDTIWGAYLLERARSSAKNSLDLLKKAIQLLEDEPMLSEKYSPVIAGDIQQTEHFLNRSAFGWDEAVKAAAIPVSKLAPAPRNYPDPEFRDRIKAMRESWKDCWNSIKETLAEPGAVHLSEIRIIVPALRGLFLAVRRFEDTYKGLKASRGVMDFNDISHAVIKLLCVRKDNELIPSETADLISSRYAEVLIDEFQDTNELQNLLAKMLTDSRNNLFMVGDVKQSIYRFRLAEPEIFQQYYMTYDDYTEDMEHGKPARVILSKNFRSRPEVIDAVNSVFPHLMIGGFTQISYGNREQLYNGRECEQYTPEQNPYKPEFCVIDVPTPESDEEESIGKTEVEADYVADRIRLMLDTGFMIEDGGEKRRIRCEDIVILLRSASSKAEYFERALAAKGIESSTDKGGAKRTSELLAVLSILAVIDNAYQDIPLVGMMTSPVYQFTPDELSEIRSKLRRGAFYDAVVKAAKEGNQKCIDFLESLRSLRTYSGDNGVDRLLWHIYTITGLPGIYSAMADGASRRRNLMRLYEHAVAYEKDGRRGISGFINYIEKTLSKGTFSSDDSTRPGAVRIMTIHKSKGMEFPVVFLCDLSSKFNLDDTRKPVLVHPKTGIGLKILDRERLYQYPTLVYTAVSRKIREESLAEEMRILYVAMTRAKDKLIMTCAFPDANRKVASILKNSDLDNPEKLLSADGPSKWLLPIIASHPSGKQLREISNTPYFSCDEPGDWSVNLIYNDDHGNKPATRNSESEYPIQQNSEVVVADICDNEIEGFSATIEKWLQYEYPYGVMSLIPSKITATQLKGKAYEFELSEQAQLLDTAEKTDIHLTNSEESHHNTITVLRRPKFISGTTGLTPAERGTALHLAMQFVDLLRCKDLPSIEEEIDRLRDKRILTEQQASAVDPNKILNFMKSELGQRMLSAKSVQREFKFSLLDDCSNYFPTDHKGDKILVQGVCDLFFEEDDGIVIVDFKSDRISSNMLQKRAMSYRPQIELYSRALERITSKRVKEKNLYFFAIDQVVQI